MPVLYRRILIFILLLSPFLYLLAQVIQLQMGEWDILGPEPGKEIAWFTGEWALYSFIASFAVTPLKQIFSAESVKQKFAGKLSFNWLLPHRRMLGLFAFFYATAHLLAYCAFLLNWQWDELSSELIERPYLTLGFLAWLLFVPLAITSTKGWQRRLKRKWKSLHKLVYPIAMLIAVHYLLQIRASWLEPVAYSLLLLGLLVLRKRNKRT